jgi:hypothetical protein
MGPFWRLSVAAGILRAIRSLEGGQLTLIVRHMARRSKRRHPKVGQTPDPFAEHYPHIAAWVQDG